MMKKIKTLGVLGVVLGLILSVLGPAGRAWAEEHGSGEYRLTVSVDSNADWVAYGTVNQELLNTDDIYYDADGHYVMTLELHIPNEDERVNVGVRVGGDSGGFEYQQASEPEDWQGTHRKYTFTMQYTAKGANDHLSLNPFSEDGGAGGEGGDENVFFEGCEEDDGCHGEVIGVDEEGAWLRLTTLWHKRFVGNVVVNGEVIPVDQHLNYDNQKEWLDNYHEQTVGFEVLVPEAADGVYNVEVETERSEQDWIGNFLWTADPEQEFMRDGDGEIILDEDGNSVPGKNYIGNSRIDLVGVEYTIAATVYGCDARTMECWEYYEEEGPESGLVCNMAEDEGCGIPYLEFYSGDGEYDDGSLVLPAGATLTMRVIPDYGYQVMNVNMADLVVDEDGVGVFSFTVPGGAAYFVADVVPVEDKFVSESEVVSGGSVDLGGGQTTLEQGSAKLQVEDVDLNDMNVEGFVGAAEGYEVKNYLNISLYNVVCKGGAVCEGTDEDSWTERVRELNEEATITLELEEGVDGNEVVIVHEKGDGTFEVIPAEYDAEANTITFKTSSFSNYAIASRTVEEGTAPETGRVGKDGGFAKEAGVVGGAVGGVSVIMFGAYLLARRKR